MFKRIALLAVALVFTFAVFELGLRALTSLPHPYERGTLLEWWQSPPNRYVPSAHIPTARVFEPDPAILPGLGRQVRFTTNEFGFRSPRLKSVEKPESQLRIFAIGGSTTECSYLDDADAWPELIGERLSVRIPDVDVVNVGHSGDTTRDHIALLAQRIVAFQPDQALFLVGINDMGL